MKRKGQGMIFGLIIFVTVLFAYAFMLPIINDAVNLAAPNLDAATLLLAQAIPFLLLILLVAMYLSNTSPLPVNSGY